MDNEHLYELVDTATKEAWWQYDNARDGAERLRLSNIYCKLADIRDKLR